EIEHHVFHHIQHVGDFEHKEAVGGEKSPYSVSHISELIGMSENIIGGYERGGATFLTQLSREVIGKKLRYGFDPRRGGRRGDLTGRIDAETFHPIILQKS